MKTLVVFLSSLRAYYKRNSKAFKRLITSTNTTDGWMLNVQIQMHSLSDSEELLIIPKPKDTMEAVNIWTPCHHLLSKPQSSYLRNQAHSAIMMKPKRHLNLMPKIHFGAKPVLTSSRVSVILSLRTLTETSLLLKLLLSLMIKPCSITISAKRTSCLQCTKLQSTPSGDTSAFRTTARLETTMRTIHGDNCSTNSALSRC